MLGDPDTLAADLLESTFGQQWYSLVDSLGFVFDTKPRVALPAGRPARRLRTVRLLTDAGAEPPRPRKDTVSAP